MNSSLPDTEQSIPLSIEEIRIAKRRFVRSDVRVRVQTEVWEVSVHELLTDERIEVEHVAVGRYVDVAPAIRQDGDTMIISLVEEVVERRLILKEEIHLRRVRTRRTHEESVTLREEKVTIERTSRTTPDGPDTVQATRVDHPEP